MKPLTNMQLAMDIIIVLNGTVIAIWIFSKAMLNMVLAANKWVGASERSDSQTSESSITKKELAKLKARCF